MKVAIFGSQFQSEKLNQIWSVFDALHDIDAEIYVCKTFHDFLTSTLVNPPVIDGIIESNDFSADFALSIGGDGTYLRTAHSIGNKNIPILGINTGRLGFLAEVDSIEIDAVIMDLYKRNFRITELSQLHLSINGESFEEYPCALNEIAILKRDLSSMINIHASVNGEYLNGYQADGLVVATPTGSTAYALSVGGPIMMPESKTLLVAPVAPHNLTARPLVLDDSAVIELEVESRSQNFLVSLDGRSYTMPCSIKLQITKADYCIKAIKRPGHTFINTLRKKLMWGVDPRG
ncbi:MAG: NAD kinase [Bacteroidales bacterium]|nr:NAD kinase [Bacteroidales bacterium]MDD3906780.1 NAD kinase [Bacteroidales bacterium]MDD4712083.1 NAD kinase [Bacteroidales bacterium]MEA4839839.1 NAD kinase [Bacteroidales bacterium]